MTWYKNNKGDKIWWLDNGPRVKGKRIFSFDKEKQFNLFRDYPQALTDEEKKFLITKIHIGLIFLKENQ